MDNSHLRAWDAILYNQREKLAKPFDHWDVWGLNLATDDPTSPPIKPPTPPLGFPSRFDGNELLGKSEYEFQVRCYLETQFMLRLGELGLNYQMIAPWVIDYLKQWGQEIIDKYWDEFDDYLRKKGWTQVREYRALRRNINWLILNHCDDYSLSKIQKYSKCNENLHFEIPAIKKAVREMENALDFKSPRQRGGSRPGHRNRSAKAPKASEETQSKERRGHVKNIAEKFL